jgi:hypothetical protein
MPDRPSRNLPYPAPSDRVRLDLVYDETPPLGQRAGMPRVAARIPIEPTVTIYADSRDQITRMMDWLLSGLEEVVEHGLLVGLHAATLDIERLGGRIESDAATGERSTRFPLQHPGVIIVAKSEAGLLRWVALLLVVALDRVTAAASDQRRARNN